MKTKPILFSTEMVQAILEGRKTQTRRIMNPQPIQDGYWWKYKVGKEETTSSLSPLEINEAPIPLDSIYGNIGDVLWVRENFYVAENYNQWSIHQLLFCDVEVFYTADIPYFKSKRPLHRGKNRPSIHMPKKFARIFLKVTNIKIERLNDISEADAIAEGIHENPLFRYDCYLCGKKGHIGAPNCEDGFFHAAKDSFFSLWESITGKESLESNPWVWVIEFEKVEKPENF